jgi:hypothetical protein
MWTQLSAAAEAMANGANIAAMIATPGARTSRSRRCRVAWPAAALLTAAVAVACGGSRNEPAAPAIAGPSYSGELPPLPRVQYASARPEPLIRTAYEFAGRHPEVLKHMPCFCGCERNKHGHNGDCFVAGRDADGKPRWSPHGIGCAICIDVAVQAARMHGEGAGVAAIRAAVEQKYRAEYPTSTPTAPVSQ